MKGMQILVKVSQNFSEIIVLDDVKMRNSLQCKSIEHPEALCYKEMTELSFNDL